MLAANVASVSMTAKPRELDLRSAAATAAGQDAARTMASRKIQSKPSALPQGPSRAAAAPELRVYRPASGSIPVPSSMPGSKLRKQHSLTNLAVLTDAEKKMHLYQSPLWSDDHAGKTATAGQPGGGKLPLSRTLSKSEQSLFQGKPKPLSSPAGTPSLGKPSRIPAPGKPRGPYAEVKPISQEPGKGPEPSEPSKPQSNGTTGSTGINAKKPAERSRGTEAPSSAEEKKKKEAAKEVEVEGEAAFLKVDPELVVTVLGDLEQLLFSQILGESNRTLSICTPLRYVALRVV